jgi:hypothetical protein
MQDLRLSECCGPLVPEVENNTVLQNMRNHSLNDTASHPRSLEASESNILNLFLKKKPNNTVTFKKTRILKVHISSILIRTPPNNSVTS